ncbi:unnamed protein product [Clavelina lepadiformis]|uniref:Uncharacterized protein n=1 Tax=Clavelina lepadiformis TaxID=159417 RepID=A0ABP0GAE0_CLALP
MCSACCCFSAQLSSNHHQRSSATESKVKKAKKILIKQLKPLVLYHSKTLTQLPSSSQHIYITAYLFKEETDHKKKNGHFYIYILISDLVAKLLVSNITTHSMLNTDSTTD